jgi:hypothetical protein
MQNRRSLGQYLKVNPFAKPDDYLAFINVHREPLLADALEGHKEHGRGIVLLQGMDGPFVASSYVTCEPGDFGAFQDPADARQHWEEYDPETELLVGINDPGQHCIWLWRMRFA